MPQKILELLNTNDYPLAPDFFSLPHFRNFLNICFNNFVVVFNFILNRNYPSIKLQLTGRICVRKLFNIFFLLSLFTHHHWFSTLMLVNVQKHFGWVAVKMLLLLIINSSSTIEKKNTAKSANTKVLHNFVYLFIRIFCSREWCLQQNLYAFGGCTAHIAAFY